MTWDRTRRGGSGPSAAVHDPIPGIAARGRYGSWYGADAGSYGTHTFSPSKITHSRLGDGDGDGSGDAAGVGDGADVDPEPVAEVAGLGLPVLAA
jgi:hypothetical protein